MFPIIHHPLEVLMPELYNLINTYKDSLYADDLHRPDTYWGSCEFLAV